MNTKKKKIISKAVEIIKGFKDGIRYMELVNKIQKEFLDISNNTIHGTVWNLDKSVPHEIYKPARGLFRHISYRAIRVEEEEHKIF